MICPGCGETEDFKCGFEIPDFQLIKKMSRVSKGKQP